MVRLSMLNKIKFAYKKLRKTFNSKKDIEKFNAIPELRNLHKLFSADPESKWIIGQKEALRIYQLIKDDDPKNIIELGLGIGAGAAIMAMASSPDARITSLEQYQKCIDIVERIFPKELRGKVKFIFSSACAFQNTKISKYLYFSGYRNLPLSADIKYDFVVIDGPGAFMEGNEFVKLPNGDLINLLPYLKFGCKIFCDGRKKQVEIYERYLSDYVKVMEREQNYTVFERTEKQLKNMDEFKPVDLELFVRTKKGYF